MDEGLKRRLVGATVLVSLAVIFVPMLLEDNPVVESGINKTNIPPMPEHDFSSRVIPSEGQPLSVPPEPRPAVVPLKPAPQPKIAEKGDAVAKPSTESAVKIEADSEKGKEIKPRVGLSAWVVQVGSFSNRENAQKLVKQIRDLKYAAFMEQADVDGKTVYRVQVGPEIDRKLAEKMLVKLNRDLKSLNLKGSIKSYP